MAVRPSTLECLEARWRHAKRNLESRNERACRRPPLGRVFRRGLPKGVHQPSRQEAVGRCRQRLVHVLQ
jgi:hypothetical protein